MSKHHICVCICTYQRQGLLRRLLEGIAKQQTGEDTFTLSCVVIDNDANGSARDEVDHFTSRHCLPILYGIEPERNFALVRNHALRLASGDYIAFIDDDEVPVPEWLSNLLAVQKSMHADGVLGPVRPYFDEKPPDWIVKGRLCERPAHPTGMVMHWTQTRTGNVLLKRSIFTSGKLWFDPSYGSGGEDVDFFKRAIAAGYRFVWCEEAPAYELVPPSRLRKSYFLRRGLLQGRISLKYATDKLTLICRLRIASHAFLALLLYTLALPFLALGGFHYVMKYLIKCCHHLGRFSAVFGIEIVRQRNF
jgi:succinoglycan biosynthesis protein ExoM